MRVNATNQGFKYYNLGGGLGGKEDSLFKYKSSFSKDFRDFQIWRYEVNKKAYDELSETAMDNKQLVL